MADDEEGRIADMKRPGETDVQYKERVRRAAQKAAALLALNDLIHRLRQDIEFFHARLSADVELAVRVVTMVSDGKFDPEEVLLAFAAVTDIREAIEARDEEPSDDTPPPTTTAQ